MDNIAHSFKYALHNRHGLKVIWEVKVKVINRRLLIGRDGHLDESEAYDLS